MRLYDEAGTPYDLDTTVIERALDTYETNPEQDATPPETPQQSNYGYLDDLSSATGGAHSTRVKTPTETMMETFLPKVVPARLDKFWAISSHLAVGKVSSQQMHRRLELKLENLIRAAQLSGEELSLLDHEQLSLYGQLETARSSTYDGVPSERQLYTITDQRVHQTGITGEEAAPASQKRGGLLGWLFGGR